MSGDFDERAATWDDDPAKVERAQEVARAIRAAVHLDQSMRMLEYGAGTGLVTEALRDSVGPVTMADTSAGMREVMETKVSTGVIANARIWDVDLATQPVPDEQFDLIVTVMTCITSRASNRCWPTSPACFPTGGYLCIVDLEEEDGSFHAEGFNGHHGFNRTALGTSLRHAGFSDVRFEHCHEMIRGGVVYPLFLATCVRRCT